MELDPHHAYAAVETGLGQLYALAAAYSLSVLGAIALIVIGYALAGFIQRAVSGGLAHVPGFDRTLRQFFATLARYLVLGFVGVMVLGQFGVQTASIVAAIGAIGLAIGLALQGTLQNIAAGIMLLALRPFRIGEEIEVGAIAGTVEEVGLFATELRTADGLYLFAPNSTLWNQPIRNHTRNGVRREEIIVPVAAGESVETVRKELLDIAAAEPLVARQPAPAAFVSEFGGDTSKVTLRYWTPVRDRLDVRTTLARRVGGRLHKPVQA
jgi:small conductance mechanosensitive channel